MTYDKPQIRMLGDATTLIHNGMKLGQLSNEPFRLSGTLFPAYDLDD